MKSTSSGGRWLASAIRATVAAFTGLGAICVANHFFTISSGRASAIGAIVTGATVALLRWSPSQQERTGPSFDGPEPPAGSPNNSEPKSKSEPGTTDAPDPDEVERLRKARVAAKQAWLRALESDVTAPDPDELERLRKEWDEAEQAYHRARRPQVADTAHGVES